MVPADVKVNCVMEMCTVLCAGCPQYSIWESYSAAKLMVTILKLPLPSVACPDMLRIADIIADARSSIIRYSILMSEH